MAFIIYYTRFAVFLRHMTLFCTSIQLNYTYSQLSVMYSSRLKL